METPMNQRHPAEKPTKVKFRLIEPHGDKEAQSELEVSGNNALQRRDVREMLEIEIDLSNDELLQGIKVTDVEPKRGIVREVATGIVAILLITFIFIKTDVPQAIMLSILVVIVSYFFGKLISLRP